MIFSVIQRFRLNPFKKFLPTISCSKAMLSNLNKDSGTSNNKMELKGNDGPRDHLQVTSSHQRDADIHMVKVIKIEDISPTVKKLVLHTDVRPVPFSFKAGQWIDLFIPTIDKVGGFSMTSSPTYLTSSGKFHLAVKYSEHTPAKWIHEQCKEGCELPIRVGGNFFVDFQSLSGSKDKKALLFIAGGVGINPLTSMVFEMRDLAIQQAKAMSQLKSVLLFSAKTSEELLFLNELNAIAKNDSNFRPFYFLTGDSKPDAQYPVNFKRGRIDLQTLSGVVTEHLNMELNSTDISENLLVYICGPPGFIKFMEASLMTMGIKKIFFENWWQSE